MINSIIAAEAGFRLTGIAATTIGKAVSGMYGVAGSINDFLDHHINEMKCSTNQTVCKTGLILEGAKFGFGLGYLSSVAIIAAGQIILGNTLAATITVATAATLSNPIAMTCGAVGAIIYGWDALGKTGQEEILERLAAGLEVGMELIRAIINYVRNAARNIKDSKIVDEMKLFVSEKAQIFSRSIADITGSTADMILVSSERLMKQIDGAFHSASNTATGTVEKLKGVVNRKSDLPSPTNTVDTGKVAAKRLHDIGGNKDTNQI